jgi:hypothetical protein
LTALSIARLKNYSKLLDGFLRTFKPSPKQDASRLRWEEEEEKENENDHVERAVQSGLRG